MSDKLKALLTEFGVDADAVESLTEGIERINKDISDHSLVSRSVEAAPTKTDETDEAEAVETVEVDETFVNAVADVVVTQLQERINSVVEEYKQRAADLEDQNETFKNLVVRLAGMIELAEDDADDAPASTKQRVAYRPTANDNTLKPQGFAAIAKATLGEDN